MFGIPLAFGKVMLFLSTPANCGGPPISEAASEVELSQNLMRRRNMERIKRFLKDEEGVTAIEYGLLAALIAVAIITAVGLVGTNLTGVFNTVAGKLN
jgi:pilus assembly protein Flp/PilA